MSASSPRRRSIGIDGFEHARLVAGRSQRHLHGGAHQEAAAGDRIERHVLAPRLHDHFVARTRRHDLAEALGAGAEDAAVRAEQRQLDRLALLARFVEQRASGRRAAASSSAIVARALHVLAHAQVERGARQRQRVFQAFADLDVEPAVDAAVEEHDGEIEHEQQRHHRQRRRHPHHARFQARADHALAPVADQLHEAAADQDQQHQQAGDVDADDERMQVAEVRRLLHRLRHDQERSDPQPRADQDQDRDQRAFQSCGDHVYHSLR